MRRVLSRRREFDAPSRIFMIRSIRLGPLGNTAAPSLPYLLDN